MYENFVRTRETVRNREVSVLERCPHGEVRLYCILYFVLYCVRLCCVVLYCIVLYCIVWYGMVLYGMIW